MINKYSRNIINCNLKKTIENSIKLKSKIFKYEKEINLTILRIYQAIKKNKKIFICGNGGSAADAQHLAAEFLVRLRPGINRRPLPIISLAQDTSTLTACSNDYGFEYIFSRNLQALANKGDLLICISTSGNSKNIINVLKQANKMKIHSISLLGSGGGGARKLSKINIIIPSNITARIQECHIFLGHFVLESVENLLLKKISYYD
jgi:D-sedoheptulose 7-phosphate isomerase